LSVLDFFDIAQESTHRTEFSKEASCSATRTEKSKRASGLPPDERVLRGGGIPAREGNLRKADLQTLGHRQGGAETQKVETEGAIAIRLRDRGGG